MSNETEDIRFACVDDASHIAGLLHDFNGEFDVPSPPQAELSKRLTTLLQSPTTFALLAGQPACGVALVSLRSNIWYSGLVALLDEFYVVPHRRGQGIGSAIIQRFLSVSPTLGIEAIEINVDEFDLDAQRLYRRYGFSDCAHDAEERALYFHQDLVQVAS